MACFFYNAKADIEFRSKRRKLCPKLQRLETLEVDAMTLDQYVRDLREITTQHSDPVDITDLVAPLAKNFAQSPELRRPEYRECDAEQGFGVHMLHEEPNHDLAVFLVSWLPNRGTTPHNHKTWAVVVGIEGQEQEINDDRLDDGGKPG